MNNKINYLLILLLVISLAGNVLFYFKISALEIEIKKIRQNENQSLTTAKDTAKNENNNITYITFSSPKADFTFEYPSTWVYEEKPDSYDPNATDWIFYQNSKKIQDNLILAVISPLTEVVDFCSVGYRSEERSYKISIFPTNDPKTFITYEQCGEEEYGSTYIYWQRGEYFRNANDIKDILKIDLMIYYSGIENNNQKITKHIAQSIKIK